MPTFTPMLSLDQFSIGPISSAGDGLTFVLPRTGYENRALVSRSTDQGLVVLLDDEDPFSSFPVENNHHYSGVLVGDVRIELNPFTAQEMQYGATPLGTIVRKGTELLISNAPVGHMRFRPTLTPILTGLMPLPDSESAGFLNWRVVVGTGRDKQVLAEFTIGAPA